ncbi:hypothetical protein ES705_14432 [subsurface metagenome]
MGIVQQIFKLISPTLRKMIEEFAHNFKKTALESDNPVDDIGAYLLFVVLGLPWD